MNVGSTLLHKSLHEDKPTLHERVTFHRYLLEDEHWDSSSRSAKAAKRMVRATVVKATKRTATGTDCKGCASALETDQPTCRTVQQNQLEYYIEKQSSSFLDLQLSNAPILVAAEPQGNLSHPFTVTISNQHTRFIDRKGRLVERALPAIWKESANGERDFFLSQLLLCNLQLAAGFQLERQT